MAKIERPWMANIFFSSSKRTSLCRGLAVPICGGRFNWRSSSTVERTGCSLSTRDLSASVAHVIRPSDVRKHLSCLPASNGFPALMACELRLPTKNHSPCFRTLAALAGPCPDQFALELGETSQNGQHQTTIRRRGVSPSIAKRFEARPFLSDRPRKIKEIPCGSR
jgi:hypothetical protein